MGFFTKKYKVNEKEYGHIISRMIFTTAHNQFSKLFENFSKPEDDFYYFSQLLLHYTYICNCLLKNKYSNNKADNCISYTIESFARNYALVNENEQDNFIKLLDDIYSDIKKNEYNIFSESGLHNLAQSYQDCFENSASSHIHLTIYTSFSNFIIYHTSDILNDNLILS